MSATTLSRTARFRAIFDRVCDDFSLPAQSREIAWRSCFTTPQQEILSQRVMRIYRILDATKGPWRPNDQLR